MSLLIHVFTHNKELNDLRKIICLRNSELTVERISSCSVTEKFMEQCIHQ